jgi:hypothetical protein
MNTDKSEERKMRLAWGSLAQEGAPYGYGVIGAELREALRRAGAEVLPLTGFGWDMAVDMGTYSFVFADGRKVTARYTFVYRPRAGEWLITHHHSSVLPEQFCKV